MEIDKCELLFEEIGSRVKEGRFEKRISQRQMAEKLDVAMATISNWECGRSNISIKYLLQIGEILNMSLADLMGLDEKGLKQKWTDYDDIDDLDDMPPKPSAFLVKYKSCMPIVAMWNPMSQEFEMMDAMCTPIKVTHFCELPR